MLEGEITIKLGDDVVTLGPRDAVLIPAATPRARATLGRAGGAGDGLGDDRRPRRRVRVPRGLLALILTSPVSKFHRAVTERVSVAA